MTVQTFETGYVLGRKQEYPMLPYSGKKLNPAFSRGWHIGWNMPDQALAEEMIQRAVNHNDMDAPL